MRLRARVGKKRLRGTGQDEQGATSGTRVPRARVRNRLLASVVLCAVAVLAAGAPGVANASRDLSESQDLVDRAEVGQRAISLAHALADERDDVVRYIAAGRTTREGVGVSEPQRSRVDRKAAELRENVPGRVRELLDRLPAMRQEAIAGDGGSSQAYKAYTKTIQALGAIPEANARALPRRAASGTAAALPDLGRAVEQASASRGLLLAALAAGGSQPKLTAAAQQAYTREQAALADFEQTAQSPARDSLAKTVNGTDVAIAEAYLNRLTAQPRLGVPARGVSRERVDTTLSARIDRMRGVQSSLAGAELTRLEQLRDEDVTALQLRLALLGACLLLAVGISVHIARSMARPLAAVRLGAQRVAADPAGEEPVKYIGREDEFADVVRSVNELRELAARLQQRASEAEADNTYLVGTKDRLAAERERLRQEQSALRDKLESLHSAVHGTFVQLALRNLGLVERQLALIESLEEKEAEPDQLATLFKLDHMATRMRRHGENLLLLAGAEHSTSHHPGPVPLLDVLRAAISEIERYDRVELASLPPHAQVSGFAADDVSHLVAELLDNATAFSPPDAEVQLSGWLLENGEVMLSVQDEGIGMTTERLAELNARLGEPDAQGPPSSDGSDALGMGLYVVARLAARHGMRVQLREQKQGGVAAVVVLPRALLPDRPAPGPMTGGTALADAAPALPGSVAEANSNTLPWRTSRRAVPEPVLIAPDEHGRAGEDVTPAAPEPEPEHEPQHEPEHEPQREPAVAERRITDKGLPKRTPKITEPIPEPRERGQGVNAEELRRRLGGFQQGARDGHRDAAAETATPQSAQEPLEDRATHTAGGAP
ncbi:nitrate- and nitrite sensing domain-containing protein [Streptomyces gobiensis]|uniref:sensor histidine kinase n=1 Tax=Streptomyces gobiensis TaxID=2875706 RepID=UPI001E58B0B9|nr:nitrate- and nitrite sensing domain-containing protein [Streptomyces gobiensis]UGY93612.1 nitrate- and nitrite sensing domain-containing protein [Streptomyces gobiensis]